MKKEKVLHAVVGGGEETVRQGRWDAEPPVERESRARWERRWFLLLDVVFRLGCWEKAPRVVWENMALGAAGL